MITLTRRELWEAGAILESLAREGVRWPVSVALKLDPLADAYRRLKLYRQQAQDETEWAEALDEEIQIDMAPVSPDDFLRVRQIGKDGSIEEAYVTPYHIRPLAPFIEGGVAALGARVESLEGREA